jgi:pilus assembly protein CpaB
MTYRTRNILIASALAALAAIFMLVYISKSRNNEDVGNGLVSVFVAGRTIDEGTPGSALTGGSLLEKRVPRKAVAPGAITSPNEIRARVATETTYPGEQVSVNRFGSIAETGVLTKIRKRQRAVQFAGDANQVLDGTLKAGDRVDIVGTWKVGGADVVRTIVQNVLVLATSTDLSATGTGIASSGGAKPVQLRLTGRQAERVYWMAQHGAWWLVLRPVVKPRNTPQKVQTGSSIVRAKNG